MPQVMGEREVTYFFNHPTSLAALLVFINLSLKPKLQTETIGPVWFEP
jgi:hypothetical protein